MVSIVIPCFVATAHQAALLDETLASVDAQTHADYEIIVVDDGSPVAVSPIVARHARARTIRQPNAGCAVARNTGIAEARGGRFVFLDADDHLLPQALEAGLRELRDHPDAGFVVGPRREMTYDGQPVPWGIPSPPRRTHLYETLLGFDWYIIPPSSAMFARDLVERIGGFRDPWGADDLDFYLRAASHYPGWCYDAPAVTCYRRYSTSSSRDGERMLCSARAVYERQRPLVAGQPRLEAAYARGLSQLTRIFIDCLVENVSDRVAAGDWRRAWRSACLLARERPRGLLELIGGTRA
jgi:glycosyltransferase involved in cell wall biosynthesis